MAKNWFQAYLRLDVPQMEKSDRNIHVFISSQAIDSSADFSWRHLLPFASTLSDYREHHQIQTGSRNYPKPEVLIT